MTEEQIVDLLEQLISNYPNTKIKDVEKMIETWQMAFGECEAGDIYMAARYHMDTCEFFPTIAEIKQKVNKAKLLYSTPVPAIEEPSVPKLEDGHMTDDEYIEYIIQFLGIGCEAIDS